MYFLSKMSLLKHSYFSLNFYKIYTHKKKLKNTRYYKTNTFFVTYLIWDWLSNIKKSAYIKHYFLSTKMYYLLKTIFM